MSDLIYDEYRQVWARHDKAHWIFGFTDCDNEAELRDDLMCCFNETSGAPPGYMVYGRLESYLHYKNIATHYGMVKEVMRHVDAAVAEYFPLKRELKQEMAYMLFKLGAT